LVGSRLTDNQCLTIYLRGGEYTPTPPTSPPTSTNPTTQYSLLYPSPPHPTSRHPIPPHFTSFPTQFVTAFCQSRTTWGIQRGSRQPQATCLAAGHPKGVEGLGMVQAILKGVHGYPLPNAPAACQFASTFNGLKLGAEIFMCEAKICTSQVRWN
jgi:hypothetical protein